MCACVLRGVCVCVCVCVCMYPVRLGGYLECTYVYLSGMQLLLCAVCMSEVN